MSVRSALRTALIVCMLGGGAAVAAAPAPAATSFFCGTPSGYHAYSPGSRCSSGYKSYVSEVEMTTDSFGPENICALAKQYSDGSGGNYTVPACNFASRVTSTCTSGYACSNYPTNIDNDPSFYFGAYGFQSYTL